MSDAPSAATEKKTSLHPYRFGIRFGLMNAVNWNISLGPPLILLTERLGGNPVQVGIIYSMVFLLLPVQVFSTRFLSFFGFKKQMILGWGLRTVFLIIPLALALWAPADPPAFTLWLLVFSVFGFCLLRAFGASGLYPWYYAWLPQPVQGRFFATDQGISAFTSILTLLFSAGIMYWIGGYTAFFWLYLVSIFGSLAATYCLGKIPDVPKPPPTNLAGMWRQGIHLFRDLPDFRRYVLINAFYLGTAAVLVPFSIYFLKTKIGLSSGYILILTSLQFTGYIAGSYLARNILDRFRLSFFFLAAIILNIAVYLCWFLHVAEILPIAKGAYPVLFFFMGLSNIFFSLTHLKYLPTLFAAEERPLAIALQGSIQGLLSGILPIMWGFAFRTADGGASMNLTAFLIYLGSAIILFTFLAPLFARLRTGDAIDPAAVHLPTFLYRPFRFVSNVIHWPGQGKPKK
jgi:hypothetical protein